MTTNVLESTMYPVNENGEILFIQGTGSSNVVGFVPTFMVPVDSTTNKVAAIFGNIASNPVSGAGGSNWKLIDAGDGIFHLQKLINGVWTNIQSSSENGSVFFKSVTTGVGSFHLGSIHSIGSAGQNVVFKNNETNVSWFPVWQGQLSDGSSTIDPSARVFSSQVTSLPNGGVTGITVPYSVNLNVTANYSFTQVIVQCAEAYTGGLNYVVTYADGTEISRITFPSASYSVDQQITINYDYPLDVRSGDVVNINIYKDDNTILNVRAGATDTTKPYRITVSRAFQDSLIYHTLNTQAVARGIEALTGTDKLDVMQLKNLSQLSQGGYVGVINFAGDLSQFANATQNSYWKATQAGTIGGLTFSIGDQLTCKQTITGTPANLTNSAQWVINPNTNAIATTSQLGQVIPDGSVITVSAGGNITVPKATTGSLGVVSIDTTTLAVDSNGKISSKIAASTFYVVSSQAAMLALPKITNLSICTRTDLNHIFYLNANQDPTVLVNWVDGGSTIGAVQSFNTRTGAVLPVAGDYLAYVQAFTASRNYATGEVTLYSGTLYYANTPVAAGSFNPVQWTLWTPNATTSVAGVVKLSSTTPLMDGTATVGTVGTAADAGHVHPTDTSRAPLVSPALTGTPTVPTAAVNTNTTQVASTAFVVGQAATATPLVNGSATVGTSTLYARQDHVHPNDNTKANLASPAFTGTPTAPTAAVGTNTTQLANTAFVLGQAATVAPVTEATNAAVGTSLSYARQDHVHPTRLGSVTYDGTTTGINGTTLFQNGNVTFASGYTTTFNSGIVASGNVKVTGNTTIGNQGTTVGTIGTRLNGSYTASLSGSYYAFASNGGSLQTNGTGNSVWSVEIDNRILMHAEIDVFSDARAKTDIQTLDDQTCLDKVNNLRSVSYVWNDGRDDTRVKLGWIAQEVGEAGIGEALTIGAFGKVNGEVLDDYHILDKDQLSAVMWGAVRKLSNKVDELTAEIATLKSSK